jgi:hypothetical protein
MDTPDPMADAITERQDKARKQLLSAGARISPPTRPMNSTASSDWRKSRMMPAHMEIETVELQAERNRLRGLAVAKDAALRKLRGSIGDASHLIYLGATWWGVKLHSEMREWCSFIDATLSHDIATRHDAEVRRKALIEAADVAGEYNTNAGRAIAQRLRALAREESHA